MKYETVIINGTSTAVDADKFVILSSLVRIGDRVMFGVPESADGYYESDKVNNGKLGTCIGHHRYETSRGRHERNPGIYIGNGNPAIAWDDGTFTTNTNCHHLIHLGNRDVHRTTMGAFDTLTKTNELPNLPFWEDDEVMCQGKRGTVRSIDYTSKLDRIYNVSYEEGYYSYESASIMSLVKRGNIWLYYNDRSAFNALSMDDIMHTHGLMRLWTQVVNPVTKNYHFPLQDVLPALESGIIDVIVKAGMFGSTTMIGYKFDDPEVSRYANALSIKGYK